MENNPELLMLRGAHAVLPREGVEEVELLVEAGRIARISKSNQSGNLHVNEVIELSNLTLFPGFIDIHIHGAQGVDLMEASAEDLHAVARFLARNGVTAWLPTLVPAPDEDYRRAVLAVEELMREQDKTATPVAARSLGVHYEGPFVNEGQCGALRTKYFRVYSKRAALDLLRTVELEDAKHMITLAPEIEGGIELIRELRTRGFIVSIGHTRADVETLDQAVDAGARHMTHFMNAMSPLHHRAPGVVGWGLTHDEVTCDVIADGIHIHPLVLQLILRCKTPKRTLLISDAVAPAGLSDGQYQVWNETISVKDGRTSNERGSIAGSVIMIADAVRMMRNLGVVDQEVARMASLNPAKLLGIEAQCGSIEAGKRADLVALDAEGNVRLTIIGGRIAFDERQR